MAATTKSRDRTAHTKKILRTGLPRNVKEMSKEALEAVLIKKKECNTKAQLIVERLLENTVSEEWFLDSLKFISESHFQDIIEERSIIKLCGYPMCIRTLKNVPNQQYRISTKQNKVYDITERKCFCSNRCYTASKYLKSQLLTSPLWLRDKEDIPRFKTLPVNSSKGGFGEEVDLGIQHSALKEEIAKFEEKPESTQFKSALKFTQESLEEASVKFGQLKVKETNIKSQLQQEISHTSIEMSKALPVQQHKCVDGTGDNEQLSDFPQTRNKENKLTGRKETKTVSSEHNSQEVTELRIQDSIEVSAIQKDSEAIIHCTTTPSKQTTHKVDAVNKNNVIHELSETVSSEHPSKNLQDGVPTSEQKCQTNSKHKPFKNSKEHIPEVTSAVMHVEKCVQEWFTIDSLCFLLGEEKVKEIVSDKGESIKEYYKAIRNPSWDPVVQERYMKICKRLNIMELEDSQFDSQVTRGNVNLKPLPDYRMVKEEGKRLELKVNAFMEGKTSYENSSSEDSQQTSNSKGPEKLLLPLVDSHAQAAHRRRIVLDRLNRVLPDLLRTFGLTSRDVSGDVLKLVTTFTLGAHNITFKPPEWSFIGLIIIKMLSVKDKRLKSLLESNQVNKYVTLMLLSFQEDGGYLDRLLAWLTDIDNFLHKSCN